MTQAFVYLLGDTYNLYFNILVYHSILESFWICSYLILLFYGLQFSASLHAGNFSLGVKHSENHLKYFIIHFSAWLNDIAFKQAYFK